MLVSAQLSREGRDEEPLRILVDVLTLPSLSLVASVLIAFSSSPLRTSPSDSAGDAERGLIFGGADGEMMPYAGIGDRIC